MEQKRYEFRGVPFLVACDGAGGEYQNPSWFTYEDESDVRERDWKPGKGDYVVDVGAACGSYSVTALSQGAEHVWAWSPPQNYGLEEGGPGNIDYLRETLRLNGWSDRCTVYENGVYSKDGWLDTMEQEFYDRDPEIGMDSIRVTTLDSWMEEVSPSRIDWMKIDVEGAETEVLAGGMKLIRKFRPAILIENHVFKGKSLYEKTRPLLEENGYLHISTLPHHAVTHSVYVPGHH